MRHLIGITVLLAFAIAAHAQPVDPQKAKTAKEYVNAGLAAQNAKDYDTAIGLYQKAYDLVPHPVLLFNIGQAHRLAGRDDQALTFYQKYLAADPNGPQAKIARDIVKELEAKRAEATRKSEEARKAEEDNQQAAARAEEEARKVDAARKAEEARQADQARATEQARQDELARQEQEAREREEAREQPGRPLRIAGIAAAGAGVVSLGASIAFGLRAASLSNDLSKPGAVFDPKLVSNGEAAERNQIITGVAGGVLILAGAASYYLGYRQRLVANQEGVAVLVRPDLVGVSFTTRY